MDMLTNLLNERDQLFKAMAGMALELGQAKERISRLVASTEEAHVNALEMEIDRLEQRFIEETRNHDKTRHVLACRERELERIRTNMYQGRVDKAMEGADKTVHFLCTSTKEEVEQGIMKCEIGIDLRKKVVCSFGVEGCAGLPPGKGNLCVQCSDRWTKARRAGMPESGRHG